MIKSASYVAIVNFLEPHLGVITIIPYSKLGHLASKQQKIMDRKALFSMGYVAMCIVDTEQSPADLYFSKTHKILWYIAFVSYFIFW